MTFEDMVKSVKEEIDNNWRSLREPGEVILETKDCKRCKQVHPVVCHFWHKDTSGEPSLRIEIRCPTTEILEKVFKAQRALAEIGIHFDTDYGAGGKAWDWDWSLSGEHYKTVFNWFRKKRKYIRISRKRKK